MSTRDEILAALTEAPGGMTSKELAPKCPSAECDPLVVGRMVAQLRADNVIHPGTEFRDGSTIWIFGAEKVEEVIEHAIVPLTPIRPGRQRYVSPAAQAIADMRRPEPTTTRRAPDRALPPVTTPAPVRAVEPTEGNDMDVRDRVLKAITKAGEGGLQRPEVVEIVGDVDKAKDILQKLISEKLIRREGKTRSVRYFAVKDAPPQPRTPPKKINGNGHDPLYAAALTDLQEKRAVLADQLAKLDRAIEAVGALA